MLAAEGAMIPMAARARSRLKRMREISARRPAPAPPAADDPHRRTRASPRPRAADRSCRRPALPSARPSRAGRAPPSPASRPASARRVVHLGGKGTSSSVTDTPSLRSSARTARARPARPGARRARPWNRASRASSVAANLVAARSALSSGSRRPHDAAIRQLGLLGVLRTVGRAPRGCRDAPYCRNENSASRKYSGVASVRTDRVQQRERARAAATRGSRRAASPSRARRRASASPRRRRSSPSTDRRSSTHAVRPALRGVVQPVHAEHVVEHRALHRAVHERASPGERRRRASSLHPARARAPAPPARRARNGARYLSIARSS